MPDRTPPRIHAIVGEFLTVESLQVATRGTIEAGYTHVEAYGPFPLEEVAEILHKTDRPVALATLLAGMIGGLSGFCMCWYAFAIYYPIDVGGRPYNSWPAWIPITFEMTVLFAALSAAITMIVANGLPRLTHPVFDAPNFDRATRDRFFLAIESTDPRFDPDQARALLQSLGAASTAEAPA